MIGCSTCSRVFISRKKNSPGRRSPGEQELDGAGAPVVHRLAGRRAAASMRCRSASSTAGDGVSSATFWLRRCTEQSRSPRASTVPSARPRICTSTCRTRGKEPLDEHRGVAEQPAGERGDLLELGGQLLRVVHHRHAHPATAGRGLDHHRVTDARPRLRRPLARCRRGPRCRARPAPRRRPSGCGRRSCRPSR